MPLSHTVLDAVSYSSRCPPDVCVAAVLGDALRRVAVLGGRDGMPRSLGSVYGGSVTRFLGGSIRGMQTRFTIMTALQPSTNGVAVRRDGSTVLVSDYIGGSHAIHEFSADGVPLRVVGRKGRGPLHFDGPCQVYVAPDDFVFVADRNNHRVQVLTPSLDFHGVIGADVLVHPRGVCANADVVVVSDGATHTISVFNRGDGALLRRIGCEGSGEGQLRHPGGLCFMHGHRHVAVTEFSNRRVSVFSVDGQFIRHVGVGVLRLPQGVACSAFDELVVGDCSNGRVAVFGASGDVVSTMGLAEGGDSDGGDAVGVAVHGGAIVAVFLPAVHRHPRVITFR